MKKGLIILFIIILSFSLVSAGIGDRGLDSDTRESQLESSSEEETTTRTSDASRGCSSHTDCLYTAGCDFETGTCIACVDFDDGSDFFEKSSIYGVSFSGEFYDFGETYDECYGEKSLREYLCDSGSNSYVISTTTTCDFDCNDGRCIDCYDDNDCDDGNCVNNLCFNLAGVWESLECYANSDCDSDSGCSSDGVCVECTETDSGKDLENLGSISGVYRTGEILDEDDDCSSDTSVNEYFCVESNDGDYTLATVITYDCDDYCQDGACVECRDDDDCSSGTCEDNECASYGDSQCFLSEEDVSPGCMDLYDACLTVIQSCEGNGQAPANRYSAPSEEDSSFRERTFNWMRNRFRRN
ncbi:hypothetical protein HN681_01455 [archaeon]|jgi:hypothetical protein|nr:hypothetical protein [archaeon]MBT3730560.1 hypothetical protein [archaeon]MBT4669462.1 hypothetical protein [archaeon]MBT5030219.1 hypothetical protein [archaeon]MBT5287682.1 hypothetical protein [archaeon]